MLRVSEMFESIQGESTYSGLPFFFVRLTGCNLRCSYCDTTYAYNDGTEESIEAICHKVIASGRCHVLITGGEPLVQPETPRLLYSLLEQNLTVLLETNGSIDISTSPANVIKILDIKTPASGESAKMLWSNLGVLQPHDQIKFVVADPFDLPWTEGIIKRFHLDRHFTILISPVIDRIRPREVAEWILQSGLTVRLQLQLHKLLWGPSCRGV